MSSAVLNRKVEYWKHQLLDLGKRNKMINYRETKRSTLRLIEPSFEELFQRIAVSEETLTFQRAVDRENDIRVFSILSLLENLSSPLPVAIGDIKTEGSIIERQKTLKNLRSKARLSLEEQGANILYLSFGFIEWRDGKGASAQWIKSPLILVPAVLVLEALNSPYMLSKHEDDIVVNPTLQYYLKTEYGIDLPNFDADKDTLNGYLESLEKIADQRGWRILREVSLGLLSFLKISMYNDLIRNEERIKNNSIIKAMSGELEDANNIPEELRTFDLDSIKTQNCYQVMSADSSQQDAILYSKNNISFVMQGPPGTGKSQTITNIIAEALADGKKVLFVSEKMAALQVVYRRLQDAHLADFCLPLHSHKANKKEILEQIGANLSLKQTKVRDTEINNLEELQMIRQALNQYADELHLPNPELKLSCYEVYSKLEAVSDAPTVSFTMEAPLRVTQAQLQTFLNNLQEYYLAVQRIGCEIHNNPWKGLVSRTTGYEHSEKMRQELTCLQEKIDLILQYAAEIQECPDLQKNLTYALLPTLATTIDTICNLPEIPHGWIEGGKITQTLAEAENAKSRYDALHTIEQEIASVFSNGIYHYDYNGWKDRLLADVNGLIGMPFIKNISPEFFVMNASTLKEAFFQICMYLKQIKNAFGSIDKMLDIHLAANIENRIYLSELVEALKKNKTIVKKWLLEDTSNVRALVQDVKVKAEKLLELKSQILEKWETEILELDYVPILSRYKTEYTSFFKFFKLQYRSDRNKLKAFFKTNIKDLPDDTAYNLLLRLKDYHEQKAWFDKKQTELHKELDCYYNGIETDWNAVFEAIEDAERLKTCLALHISEALIDTLSKDHIRVSAALESQIRTIDFAIQQIKEIMCTNAIEINIDQTCFESSTAISIADDYLKKLAVVEVQAARLAPYLIEQNVQIGTIYHIIGCLNTHREISDKIAEDTDKYRQYFGTFFAESQTDWDKTISLLKQIQQLEQVKLYDVVKIIVKADGSRKNEIRNTVEEISKIYNSVKSSFEWVTAQFDRNSISDTIELAVIGEKIKECLHALPMMENWIDYQEAKEDCCQNGLADFIEKIETMNIYTDIERVFLKGFYYIWLGAVCDKSASVRRFRRSNHDERIKKFVELDDRQLLIAQMRIREKLIEKLPSNHQLLKATDEVAILKKELGKKRKIMPLRRLFKLIPNLLMKLKPCLMMSPHSVSYFLEAEAYHFDLVIFDEASQIFPEDAIGSIFRGAQVIIAGDSKQLPPTNFFAAATNNFDGDYDINDEEDFSEMISDSILEEAASVLPNRTLLWHYRSKHEELIAFSNREIYKNNLITFPNSITRVPDMGVEYVYVADGCYEGGGKNCNIKEAQKCLELVLTHIQKHPQRSLGIIAFSEKQQTAIENVIIDFRERNPQYEWFFDESKDEPFFVKNLENVQGDERDTIIFSICYAKDRNGKMYMRFGPLGHAGGERRLNVAITRAKCNIKLVGSILPSDIDLSRTNSEGVRMLRSYIEFARIGANALAPIEREDVFEANDEFCPLIVSFLEDHGYKVCTKVGCSDYKIDIAVANPKAEGEFIAGIECDGLSYIHAKTARDRDHLRKTVLQSMGWNLYRVWSTAWIRNPVEEGEALLAFLRSVVDKKGKVIHNVKNSNEKTASVSIKQIAREVVKPAPKEMDDNPYGFDYYKETDLRQTPHTGERDNDTLISEFIQYVVSIEQPIHIETLYTRMEPAFNVIGARRKSQATELIRSMIDNVIAGKMQGKVSLDDEGFLWLLPQSPIVVRIPKEDDKPRQIEYIHTREIAAAMIKIIEYSFGITLDDLVTECARVFGYLRKTQKIKRKMEDAVLLLMEEGTVKIIDDKMQLTNNR